LASFKHTELGRLRPSAGGIPTIYTQATSQNLADRRGAARHAITKTEIVESCQLPEGQHDLQSFVAFPVL
jgi:hypothetical protein